MTQEFHISVTPIGEDDYLVRTERVAPGVPLAEEQVTWPVDDWLTQASLLMNDPLQGILRGDILHSFSDTQPPGPSLETQGTLVALGQQLYNALFQGTIRDSWMTAQGIAQHRQEVLRLRLGLKDTRLPRLPWEVLHAGNRPIATGTDVVFSRYHSSFAAMASLLQFQPTASVNAEQPLKILMVLAAPTDQEMLALKQEALHLQEELQTTVFNGTKNGSKDGRSSEIQLTILEQPGREQLTQALEHNHYHVLHYAGHSNLGTAGGQLYLVSNKTGLTETLSGDDLAGLLVNNGTRMAVFNSCRGVYTATQEAVSDSGDGNLAEALVRRGIPAVLAMAERIPDDVALNLSRLFYRNLKQVYPIDLSLNRARQGLVSSYSSNQLYWALPILYLHPEFDGNLQSLDGLGEPSGMLLPDRVTEEVAVAAAELALVEMANERSQASLYDPLTDAALQNLETDEPLNPDELEFDDLDYQSDPEYQSDMETVANLVNQLSNGTATDAAENDRLLPAPPSENLLPNAQYEFNADDYLILPDYPADALLLESLDHSDDDRSQKTGAMTASALDLPTVVNSTDAASPNNNVEVYAELAQMLAETGKLTAAIAACHRAVQENPNDADAYYHLGLALNQQGYVAEATAAYHQAVQVNPTFADAYNQLGLALYQQGNLSEAIRSYDHAIQLDPSLTSAKRNLEAALLRQGNGGYTNQAMNGTAASQRSRPTLVDQSSNGSRLQHEFVSAQPLSRKAIGIDRKALLWTSAGIITTLLVGGWLFRGQWLPMPSPLADTSGTVDGAGNLQRASTNRVAALATDQLNQGNLEAAQTSIETLLDRGALAQSAAVLSSAPSQQSDHSTINFLKGRLAWQSVLAGNKDYSVDDARRYWETAVKQTPNAQYQNALGFAYYAEGKFDRASQSWFQALKLEGAEKTPPARATQVNAALPSQALIAYAGLALVTAKSATNQPPSKQASLQTEAIKLRQKVLADDPVNFQPEELAKSWLWSEQAIQDWRSTLALK